MLCSHRRRDKRQKIRRIRAAYLHRFAYQPAAQRFQPPPGHRPFADGNERVQDPPLDRIAGVEGEVRFVEASCFAAAGVGRHAEFWGIQEVPFAEGSLGEIYPYIRMGPLPLR